MRSSKVNIGFQRQYEVLLEYNTDYEEITLDEYFQRLYNPMTDGVIVNAAPSAYGGKGRTELATGGLRLSGSDAFQTGQSNYLDLKPQLIPVCPIPYSIEGVSSNAGEDFYLGTGSYVPMSWFLEYVGIEESTLLEGWFGNRWELQYAIDLAQTNASIGIGATNPETVRLSADYNSIISTIKQHWSKTFQVDPRYMKNTIQLKATRAGVHDRVTGTQLPGLNWTNHTRFPNIYLPVDYMQKYYSSSILME